MTTGCVTPTKRTPVKRSEIKRTIASRPQAMQSETAKTLSALRIATGPGYLFAGVSEGMLKAATRR